MISRRVFMTAAALGSTIVGDSHAADSYPSRTVRVVVAYAPGGAVDTVARRIAQKLSEQTGQQFIVDNKPGASGTIGTRDVARSEPDGYTLLAIDNTFAILPYVFTKLPFDHASDLVPVTLSAIAPIMLTVGKDSPYKDLGALLDFARANPEKLTFGTGGKGSTPHFSAEAFRQAADIKLYHVPYKGAGEAVVGAMSGQVDLVMASPPSVMGNIRGGLMRALAVSGTHRISALPDVPTFAEAGVPQFGVFSWSGLAAPKGTSPEIVATLRAEVVKALAAPDVKEFLTAQGAEPGGMASDDFAKMIRDETERWRDVAAKADVLQQ